jgi:hypothetical protein
MLNMKKSFGSAVILVTLGLLSVYGHIGGGQTKSLKLDSLNGLETIDAKAEVVTYRGRRAVHLSPVSTHADMKAMVKDIDFKNGTIELEVAGAPAANAPADDRGFIGLIFRVQPKVSSYECFYLRPTNGRSDDQLRRNHSVQYTSDPEYTWFRLRKENPGVYESYVDLEAGAWTKIKIEVSGVKAQFYVNGATQPCLIVNDLKLGESHGPVALWAPPYTDAYFSNLTIKQ